MTEKEAMTTAWREHYGNICPELIPPIHPFFEEAFLAGVKYEKSKKEKQV